MKLEGKKFFKIELQDFNVMPQCEETDILLQQNDTQSKQHIWEGGLILHLLAKWCYSYWFTILF